MKNTISAEWSLAELIERGGVHYNVAGQTPKEFITAAIGLLPSIPETERENLLKEILNREELMSTGIGRGIALPHPRNPVFGAANEGKPLVASPPLVAVAFPAQPVGWNVPDGCKVHTAFIIISISAKQHLGALSKINFLCQQEKFYSLIKAQASKEKIIAAVRKAEAAWIKAE
jgi:PTS system nitrogen regulatory IIA component